MHYLHDSTISPKSHFRSLNRGPCGTIPILTFSLRQHLGLDIPYLFRTCRNSVYFGTYELFKFAKSGLKFFLSFFLSFFFFFPKLLWSDFWPTSSHRRAFKLDTQLLCNVPLGCFLENSEIFNSFKLWPPPIWVLLKTPGPNLKIFNNWPRDLKFDIKVYGGVLKNILVDNFQIYEKRGLPPKEGSAPPPILKNIQ